MTDRLLFKLPAAALVAALALSACKPGESGPGGLTLPGAPPAPPPDPTEAFLKSPARAEAYTALERNFPEDYARIRAELDAMLKGGKSEAEVQARAFELFREFTNSHAEQTVQAPDAQLVALAHKQVALMTVLQQDNVEACAQITRVKFESDAGLTPRSRAALSAVTAAQLEATKAGMAAPNKREGLSGEAVFGSFTEALKRENVSQAAQEAAFADEADNPPAALVCEGGLGIARAIASMPPDQAAAMQALALAIVLAGKKPSEAGGT